MVARCLNCKAMEFHELNLLPKSALYVYWKRNINNVECEPQWAPICKDNQDGGEWFRTWDSLGAAFHSDFPAAWKWREALSHTVRSLPVMCGLWCKASGETVGESDEPHVCTLPHKPRSQSWFASRWKKQGANGPWALSTYNRTQVLPLS